MSKQKKSSPKTVFMSGATGHLGTEMVRQLLDAGHRVKVMSRPGSSLGVLDGLEVEAVASSLDDQQSLEKAMKGADWVFHVAANVSFWNGNWTKSYRDNVIGTRNMARAAMKSGVGRFISTSTVAALGKEDTPDLQKINEKSTYNMESRNMVYPHTKWLGEQEVHEAVKEGLDAVITHPSVILGPGDVKHHFLPLFKNAKQGMFVFYPVGMRNTVDVRDCARGHLLAAELGGKDEHYILGGENITNDQMFEAFANAVGGPKPIFKIPTNVFRFIGKANDAIAEFTNKEPLFTEEMTFQASLFYELSCEKAEKELGYTWRPFREAMADLVAWYQREGLLA